MGVAGVGSGGVDGGVGIVVGVAETLSVAISHRAVDGLEALG